MKVLKAIKPAKRVCMYVCVYINTHVYVYYK